MIKWEIRCPYCGLIEPLQIPWPTATQRCWRELPFHTERGAPCPGIGLVVESEGFECSEAELALERDLMDIMRRAPVARPRVAWNPSQWTGPRESDLRADGVTLWVPVPPERWPYGLPEAHEDCCILHERGLHCDCKASAADEWDWGRPA